MRIGYQTVALFLSAAIGAGAANSALGFVSVQGSFQLDNSRIWGNATLFEGSVLATKLIPSRIHLSNGTEIQMAAESTVTFFRDRAVIEKGSMRLQSPAVYTVDARAFQVSAAAASTAVVGFDGHQGVSASAATGQLLITNREGTLVADVTAGKAVTVTPDSGGGSGLTKLTGCLFSRNKSFLLVDQASNITVEVRGSGVASEKGNRVEIAGTMQPASRASAKVPPVVNVSRIDRLEAGACSVSAAPRKAPAGQNGAISSSRGKIALIGGVTVASTVAGLGLAREFSSSETESQPATSR